MLAIVPPPRPYASKFRRDERWHRQCLKHRFGALRAEALAVDESSLPAEDRCQAAGATRRPAAGQVGLVVGRRRGRGVELTAREVEQGADQAGRVACVHQASKEGLS